MENATADAAAVVAAGWQGQVVAMSGSEARAAGLTVEIYSENRTFLGKKIPSLHKICVCLPVVLEVPFLLEIS